MLRLGVTELHTYPAGLPADSITEYHPAGYEALYAVGYLIAASQLPPNNPSVGKLARLPHR